MKNTPLKNKTLATYLALFLGLFGILYLNKNKNKNYGVAHILLTILFIAGFILFQNNQSSILIWGLLWLGVINWCAVWLTSIYYGLMDENKWIKYIGIHKDEEQVKITNIRFAKTNGLTVLCIIIALMLGMGSLTAFIAFTIQNYYM